ncbi:MAG: HAMP domain-containing sensor histidine kinase [Bdellovibrionota bacterium]|nr:HAMP domain-containing sensor histidine kinase [Bdellovibrionota bacterium]
MKRDIERNIRTRLLSHLFEKKFTIYVASFLAACLFTYMLYTEQTSLRFQCWLGFFALYLVFRYVTTSYYLKNLDKANNNPFIFENINFIVSTYGGAIWGVSAFLFFPLIKDIEILMSIAIYTGVVAGSLTTNAASFKSSISFILSMFIPVIGASLIYDYQYHNYAALLLTFAIVGYLKGAKVIYNSIYKSVKTSLENEELVNQVIESNAKRIEAERNSLQSSRLATVGEMAAGIAHEINNPLAIISGNMDLLKLKLKNENTKSDLSKYFEACDKNVKRVSSLVKSLKRMSYDNKDDEVAKVSLRQVIDDAFSFTTEKLKYHKVDFSLNIKDLDVDLYCNGLHISQILLNLVNNSVYAISNFEKPWIKIESYIEDEFYVLEVVDCGKGIPRDVAEKIFDPFYTTKDINSGTGLGLSLSRTMAKNSGGDLLFDFKSPNTKFILKVPLYKSEKSSAA